MEPMVGNTGCQLAVGVPHKSTIQGRRGELSGSQTMCARRAVITAAGHGRMETRRVAHTTAHRSEVTGDLIGEIKIAAGREGAYAAAGNRCTQHAGKYRVDANPAEHVHRAFAAEEIATIGGFQTE